MYEITFHNVSRSNATWTERIDALNGAPVANAVASRNLFDKEKDITTDYDFHRGEGVIMANRLIVGRYTAKRIA